MRYSKFFVMLLTCFIISDVYAAEQSLTSEQVNSLIMSTPLALSVKDAGGCPEIDNMDWGPDTAFVQLRNMCPDSGNGMLANYMVDIHTGAIWEDVDREHAVDSPALQKLRATMLPSLQQKN